MMNPSAGGLIKRWCETEGVRVLTGLEAASIEPGTPLGVTPDDGQTLSPDLVIRATGVRANVDFLHGSAVELDQGVLVSACLQSRADDIFAAGDVCQGRDLSTGTFRVQAIQPTAVEHGPVAARNMVSNSPLPHSGNLNGDAGPAKAPRHAERTPLEGRRSQRRRLELPAARFMAQNKAPPQLLLDIAPQVSLDTFPANSLYAAYMKG
jgi:hypothetical protein